MKLDLIRHEVNWPLDLSCLAADEINGFSFSFLWLLSMSITTCL
jgi:hypothetical protein